MMAAAMRGPHHRAATRTRMSGRNLENGRRVVFILYPTLKTRITNEKGSVCGSVGTAVDTQSGGPQFKSIHQLNFTYNVYLMLAVVKTKIKNGPFKQMTNLPTVNFDSK